MVPTVQRFHLLFFGRYDDPYGNKGGIFNILSETNKVDTLLTVQGARYWCYMSTVPTNYNRPQVRWKQTNKKFLSQSVCRSTQIIVRRSTPKQAEAVRKTNGAFLNDDTCQLRSFPTNYFNEFDLNILQSKQKWFIEHFCCRKICFR